MAELTQEYFDKQLSQTNSTLDRVVATLDRTTALLASISVDFKDLKEDVKVIRETVDSHTTSLDAILKNTEHWKGEAAALHSAIKRHEQWITQIAEKVGIRLETDDETKK